MGKSKLALHARLYIINIKYIGVMGKLLTFSSRQVATVDQNILASRRQIRTRGEKRQNKI